MKLPLSLTKHHVTKTHWGNGNIALRTIPKFLKTYTLSSPEKEASNIPPFSRIRYSRFCSFAFKIQTWVMLIMQMQSC